MPTWLDYGSLYSIRDSRNPSGHSALHPCDYAYSRACVSLAQGTQKAPSVIPA